MESIACDESGNTGGNLLDPHQRYFVMAACNASEEAAIELLKEFKIFGSDVKVFKLLKSRSGIQKVANILDSLAGAPFLVKIYLVDKLFMAICALVETFHVVSARQRGLDLHNEGSPKLIANAVYYNILEVMGEEFLRSFTASFIEIIRNPCNTSLQSFDVKLQFLMMEMKAKRPSCTFLFSPLLDRTTYDDKISTAIAEGKYDPAIKCLFSFVEAIVETFGPNSRVLWDESPTLQDWRKTFINGSPPGHAVPEAWVESAAHSLIKERFTFARSQDVKRIQLADIVAGGSRRFLEERLSKLGGRPELDRIATIITKHHWICGGIMPESASEEL